MEREAPVSCASAGHDEDAAHRAILSNLPFTVVATDLGGIITAVNPAAEQLLGYPREELVGAPLALLGSDAEAGRADTAPDATREREAGYRRRDGGVVPVHETSTPLRAPDGTVQGRLTVAYDITKRREAEAFARHLAQHDLLTGLPNRARLLNHLVHVIGRAEEDDTQVVVLVLDLDHFKDVNDTLGHHVGDELVRRMSERLRGRVRESDLIARLGGDEFAVVLADVEEPAELEARIQRLVEDVCAPIVVSGHELVVTASMGAVSYPADGDPATLLLKADMAMYHSKANGRHTFSWFEPWMLQEANDKVALAAALRHALSEDELEVAYQPLVSLDDDTVVGMEALARWHSPVHGTVGPDRFIPVAEENGMILELGDRVLRRACADAAALEQQLGRPLRLSVNVSPRQLRSRQWLPMLCAALEETVLDPTHLELEITEGMMMDEPSRVLETLATVRTLGVGVVIDDFGTGYSSLAYLTRLPIDKIKIDRSFVHDLATGGAGTAIAEAIIAMAHHLGLVVLAEGVETEEQRSFLSSRGCDQAQGLLYSAPVPAERFATVAGGLTTSRRAGVA
ncbi:MAG: putative bifunctional diguanylate cyclase/phosphodiesterase [Marmoricola sp.]